MSLREKIIYALLPQEAKTKLNINPGQLLSRAVAGQPVYSDMSVRKAVREGYGMSIPVYRGIRSVVNAVSGVPWRAERDGEPVPNHPFTLTWAHPNPEFSGQDNMEIIIAHLMLCGKSILQPLIINAIPREFWMAMPDMVNPIPSKQPGIWIDGWEITMPDGSVKPAPPEQFIQFLRVNPGDLYKGMGDLQAAGRTVDTDNEAQDTQKVQLQNRNVPPGVFQFESSLDDDQYTEATTRVREKFLQKNKRGEPWVLGGGYKWIEMGRTPVEMDLMASRLQNKRDIAAALGVDPWWVGDREHSTYNNVNDARKSLYEDSGIPLLDDVRDTLNLKLAPLYGDNIYINYDLSGIAILREDEDKKSQIAQRYWSMGVPVSQLNDKLKLGLVEFEGWDNSYLAFSVQPVGENVPDIEEEATPDGVKIQNKTLNLKSEEQKVAHWKRVDSRRNAWVKVMQKRAQTLYSAEGKAVLKSIEGKSISELGGVTETAIKGLEDNWEKTIKAAALVMVEDFGKDTAAALGSTKTERKWEFDAVSQAIKAWAAKHAGESITSILSTNLKDVQKIIADGISENFSVSEIAKQLKEFYGNSTYKAYRTARTEVSEAAGFGQHEAAKQSGAVTTKQWISSRDDRVRETHADIDGEVKALDEPYSNGLMYPGDASGSPEEVIQCRCVEAYGTGE
jgi:HK97 family phage portal protein